MTQPVTAIPPAAVIGPVYRRKLFWVALLYFSEGLPLGVFYDIFPVYFRQQGVNLADIGLLSLLGLAWTVKFLWAPAVDWARHHRRWVSGANAGMACVMVWFGSAAGGRHQRGVRALGVGRDRRVHGAVGHQRHRHRRLHHRAARPPRIRLGERLSDRLLPRRHDLRGRLADGVGLVRLERGLLAGRARCLLCNAVGALLAPAEKTVRQ